MDSTGIEPVASPYVALRWLRVIETGTGRLCFGPVAQKQAFNRLAACSCPIAGHTAPQIDCRCGFYACRNEQELRGATDDIVTFRPGALAMAEVTMWGVVVEHEHGMRAQWQRVDKLTVGPAPCGHKADAMRRTGGRLNYTAPGEKPGWTREWRPACSACERDTTALDDVARELGVEIHPTNVALTAPAERQRDTVRSLAVALTLAVWLAALLHAVLGAQNHPAVTWNPATATAEIVPPSVTLAAVAWNAAAALIIAYHSGTSRMRPLLTRTLAGTVLGVVATVASAALALPERIAPQHVAGALADADYTATSKPGTWHVTATKDNSTCDGHATPSGRTATVTWTSCTPAGIAAR